ncbi:MAG: hypothetical protein HYY04_02670 [Chloroflexi bacterium]|nr:hypothetical protein [Chloroflexota bacterium]
MARSSLKSTEVQSRFIRRLREVSRGVVGGIGFGRLEPKPVPALLIVARLPRNEGTLAAAAAAAGADAVVLGLAAPGPGSVTFGDLDAEREAIAAALKAAGGIPCGVYVGTSADVAPDAFTALASLGVDYVSVLPHRAPVALLRLPTLGCVARLDQQYPTGPIRGLNEIDIHAFEVVGSRPEGSLAGFTLHDLATYRQVADSARRPIICGADFALGQPDLAYIRELSIEAVTIGFPADATADDVRARVASLRQSIDQLGAPVGRGRALEGPTVVLPRIQPRAEEEEPDEDE